MSENIDEQCRKIKLMLKKKTISRVRQSSSESKIENSLSEIVEKVIEEEK